MDRKESHYKRKAPGFANREVRARFKEQKSRTNREELLASKRRIPLSVLQDQDQSKVEPKKPLSTKERSDLRLEKLKEWKRLKEVAKNKENKNKKPFSYGSSTSVFKPSVKTESQNMFVSKPQAALTAKPGSTKTISSKDRPIKRNAPLVSSKTTTAAPSNISKPKPTSKVSKPAPITKVSSRLTTKPKEGTSTKSVMAVKTRPQTRSMSKSTASGTKAGTNNVLQKDSRTKTTHQQIAGVKKSATSKNISSRTVSTRTSKKVQKHTEEKMEIIVEVDNPAAMETEDGNVSPPPTPKGKNYAPVCPSPLLRSTSARRRETLFAGRNPIVDPAWIPGQVMEPAFSQPNFDDAFGNEFSPFRFGNFDSSFQFTFRKNPPPNFNVSYSSDSLDEEPLASRVTPDPNVIRRSLGSACKNTPVRHVTTNENVMIVKVVKEDDTHSDDGMEVTHSSEDDSKQAEKLDIDIPYFRKLHSDVTDTITVLCDKWDVKVAGLETDLTDGGDGMDEVLGQLRTTVGQGRLLMRKKLKQYIGLVDIAEEQSGERKTTAEDLQGFWDMVYFQVEDVYQKFKGLEKIEENGWTVREPTPKKKRTKKRQAAVKKASENNAEESERQKAVREKREAQRNRLREMRQAAKRAREETAVVCEQEQENFSTPKKSKTDVSTPNSGSAYKHGRRHSLRLRNRSIFSPCPDSVERKPFADVNQDVPIAALIAFN